MTLRSLTPIGLLALAVISLGDFSYNVQIRQGAPTFRVTISGKSTSDTTQFQIPKWAPGSYRYANYAASIKNPMAKVGGASASVNQDNETTWSIKAAKGSPFEFSYEVTANLSEDIFHYSGPATYMYVMGRKTEPITLSLDLPANWKHASGLDARGKTGYVADDYDVLADNPVTVGMYQEDHYMSNGIPHQIVYRGIDMNLVDRQLVIDECKFVSDSQSAFWGGLPFRKYVWHFGMNPNLDGAGGLEHLSSTQIGLSAGVGSRAVSVLSHEYYHAWNVKRVRSAVLGPFDYQTLPKTGALWWLEGVTDYYADLLLYRYGRYGHDYMFDNITGNTRTTRANAQRLEVSPYDSSYRVSEAAGGRGNSQGFGVNYYNTGWVLGLCLDIEMRYQTGGKASIDDVSHELFRRNRNNQPGFQEDEIRRIMVAYAGGHMGEVYDKWVMQPGELPVEAQLMKIGLIMRQVDVKSVNPGFASAYRAGNLVVTADSADKTFLQNDQIISIGDVKFAGVKPAQVRQGLEKLNGIYQVGKQMSVVVKRGNDTLTMTANPVETTTKALRVMNDPLASAEAKKLRAGWRGYTKLKGWNF